MSLRGQPFGGGRHGETSAVRYLVRARILGREGMVAERGSRKTKGVVMRGRGMSDAGGGGGRGIRAPERDACRLARKWEELSSGKAGNSPGKTSGEPKTASAGEESESSGERNGKPGDITGCWKSNQARNNVTGRCL